MKIFCLENKHLSKPARYVLEYLLNRCGFFFEWISNPSMASAKSVVLLYAPIEEKIDLSVPIIHIPANTDLPNMHQIRLEWETKKLYKYDIPLIQNSIKPFPAVQAKLIIPFDLLANIYFHLARIDEINFKHPDEVDQSVKNTILYRYGEFKIPIVDILTKWFAEQVEDFFSENRIPLIKKMQYPGGQKYAIALTHDVDFIRAFHPLKKAYKKMFVKLGLNKTDSFEKIEQLDNDHWGFDRLLDYYRSKAFKATFFFIPKYFENLNLRYRIASKKIRTLFLDLKSDQHEIAFHPSRYSFDKPSRYLKEKKKLLQHSKAEINGIRHHYLRCLYPDIWDIAKNLGLKFNSGMINRKYSGFRAGTGFPFPAFNHLRQAETGILEFPVLFFENTLPDDGNNFDEAIKTIDYLFDTTQKMNSYFTILWHTNNFFAPEVYSKIWEHIKSNVENQDAFLTTLNNHADWQIKRDSVKLTEFEHNESDFKLELALVPDLEQIAIEAPTGYTFDSDSSVGINYQDGHLIISNPNRKNSIVIRATSNE